jgi:hypothetical protein
MTAKPASPPLPPSLAANPKLSSWINFLPNGEVQVTPGKVEIGKASSRRWRKSPPTSSMSISRA